MAPNVDVHQGSALPPTTSKGCGPLFRDKLEGTREKLLAVKEHLSFLRMGVALREPLQEELDDMPGWLSEIPATA